MSATRCVEKRWLEGDIFWKGKNWDWILPRTRENWRADMRRTPPRLFNHLHRHADSARQPAGAAAVVRVSTHLREPTLAVHKLVKRIDQCL